MEKKSILLVEDDNGVRNALVGCLERYYNILEVATCAEAKKYFAAPIALALLDYKLPDGDGFDVLNELREIRPGLPAILITAYGTESLAVKAIRAGMTDYIRKPFNITYLLGRLSELLKGGKGIEQPENVGSREEFIMDGIAAHLEYEYAKDVTLEKLADMACMDKFRFCRLFKERLGMSYTAYLNKIRVQNAAELLRKSELNITEVALSVGYRSLEHFIRVFNHSYGVSPGEYKRGQSSAPQEEGRPALSAVRS